MIDYSVVIRFGLLLVRPGMLIATAPPFGSSYAPIPVKIGLSVLLALALVPMVAWPPTMGAAGLGLVLAREALIGLALGMSVRLLLAGAELAGHLIGFQVGFAYASVADPQTGARNSVIASLYGMLTMIVFLGVNGHHALLRGLVRSYALVPPGVGQVHESMAVLVSGMLGFIFMLGVQLAAPVVTSLLVVELAMGLMSRAAPALNLMTLSFPVRVIAGLVVLAAAIGAVPGVIEALVPRATALGLRLAEAMR